VLLSNGDFEQNLSVGWTAIFQGQLSTDTIDRATTFNPDPDYEARVKKYDATSAKLFQTVYIPTTDLQFSADVSLYAYEYTSTEPYWAQASVVLYYLDNNNNILGQTRICHNSPHCPYNSSNTFHMIQVAAPSTWYNYTFNIDDELDNLSGVDPSDIAKIQVALYDTTDGC
jgi:hypothetical protein